ncbi:hypothetical protein A5713_24425 [Mycobacterium sp. E2497]|nr:hypothetical protein A5713_24425 [Mycobacterium sp. E2497]
MSFLTTVPELLQAAAGQLQAIGSAVTTANSTAAFSITGVVPAAADEVSAMTAAAFAGYGQQYQAISAEASMIHEEFVKALGLSADSYSATEAANATQAAGGHVPPAHMAPVAPARPAPAVHTRVAPAAPNRVTPTVPARPVPGAPVGAGPGSLPAATPLGQGWRGGGTYGGHMTPQHGGYANADYGRHQAPYGRGGYGAHPAARVEHLSPARMTPPQRVEHVAEPHPAPPERVERPNIGAGQHISPSQGAPTAPVEHAERPSVGAGQHVSPSQLAPTAPLHRMPLAAAPHPPGEHVVHANRAFSAVAGPKPLPALA